MSVLKINAPNIRVMPGYASTKVLFGAALLKDKSSTAQASDVNGQNTTNPISPQLAHTQIVTPLPFIERYFNKEVIENAIKKNPKITEILASKGITPKISEVNIQKTKSHLFTTYLYATEIADRINLDRDSKEILYKAALLHDIGKAVIPEEIVQKEGKLTHEEKKIIDLHTPLSVEILKTTDINPEVIDIIGLHHVKISDKKDNLLAQILSVADVFSALKEERSYKSSMSDSQAFSIMASTSELSQNLVNDLRYCHNVIV